MANSKMVFYPVDNGDMTLLKLSESETTILIDMNVREAANDENNDEYYDVMTHLKDELKKDAQGRYYLDAFILTHGDQDHINGLKKNFYLGDVDNYSQKNKEDGLIIIHELWSSNRFLKRKTNDNTLCDDAKVFNTEMKRRVKLYEESKTVQKPGNRTRVIANEDEHEIVENFKGITYFLDKEITKINEQNLNTFSMVPIGPLEQQKDRGEEDDEFKTDGKNRGSLVLSICVTQNGRATNILMTGDAIAKVWEWYDDLYDKDMLKYDILHLPHHCSWYSIGYKNDNNEYVLMPKSLNSLSYAQDKDTAFLVSSSKEIKQYDTNPPHYLAKKEYLKLINDETNLLCTQEYKQDDAVTPIVIEITQNGTHLIKTPSISKTAQTATITSTHQHEHGKN